VVNNKLLYAIFEKYGTYVFEKVQGNIADI
jgi:hypothetical protein